MTRFFSKQLDQFYRLAEAPSAGLLLYCPQDKTIFQTQRSIAAKNSPSYWGIPGGRPEASDDNSLTTALREAEEELAELPPFQLIGKHEITGDYHYIIYYAMIDLEDKEAWTPQLDAENQSWGWFPANQLPSPQHLEMDWIKETFPVS